MTAPAGGPFHLGHAAHAAHHARLIHRPVKHHLHARRQRDPRLTRAHAEHTAVSAGRRRRAGGRRRDHWRQLSERRSGLRGGRRPSAPDQASTHQRRTTQTKGQQATGPTRRCGARKRRRRIAWKRRADALHGRMIASSRHARLASHRLLEFVCAELRRVSDGSEIQLRIPSGSVQQRRFHQREEHSTRARGWWATQRSGLGAGSA